MTEIDIRQEIAIKKIHTFYTLELIHSYLKYGLTNKWHSSHEIDSIEMELESFARKLKDHLLEVIEYSVCCESRHTYEHTNYCNSNEYEKLGNLTQKDEHLIGFAHSTERSSSYKIVKKYYKTPKKRVLFALRCFESLTWDTSYGGEKWAEGCRAWLKLNDAQTLQDILFWIDRCYDLQHNSGVLFNKHKDYEGLDCKLKTALDKKRKAHHIEDIIYYRTFANPYCQHIVPMVLPKYNKVVKRYLKHFPQIDTRKRVIYKSLDDYYRESGKTNFNLGIY